MGTSAGTHHLTSSIVVGAVAAKPQTARRCGPRLRALLIEGTVAVEVLHTDVNEDGGMALGDGLLSPAVGLSWVADAYAVVVVDKVEAREVALGCLDGLRALSFGELVSRLLDREETSEVVGPSGARYQLEVQGFRDGQGENLRVMVSVDDGRWRSFFPLTQSFIMTPRGSFVGE